MRTETAMQSNRSEAPNVRVLAHQQSEGGLRSTFRAGASFPTTFLSLFAASREQALFSLIWVTSILTASVSLSEGTWMSGINQLAFAGVVSLFVASGVYVFLRECWSERDAREAVESRPPAARTATEPAFRTAA